MKIVYLLLILMVYGSDVMNADVNSSKTIFYPTQAYIAEIQQVWSEFLNTHNWHNLIKNVEPRNSNCGLVYELPNYLNRPNEGLAIVDMRTIRFVEPHYHPDPVVEIYFILQGTALVVVAGQEIPAKTGSIVVIFYRQAHFVIPDSETVIAVVNTPPFEQEHHKVITETDTDVSFDKQQFNRLTQI